MFQILHKLKCQQKRDITIYKRKYLRRWRMKELVSTSLTFRQMVSYIPYRATWRIERLLRYKSSVMSQSSRAAAQSVDCWCRDRRCSGCDSKIVTALSERGIQILQSADSHTTIWVLVKEEHLKEAVNALHDAFQLAEQKQYDFS